MDTKTYRVEEAAKRLSCSKTQVWTFTKKGELKSTKLSAGITVWLESDIVDFLISKNLIKKIGA